MSNFVSCSLRRISLGLFSQSQIHSSYIAAKVFSLQMSRAQPTYFLHNFRKNMSSSIVQNVLKDRPFGPRTMMKIVKLLNDAGIPSILWGNSMLDIYGVPTIDIDMSFIVKRSSIEKARQVLLEAGLVECEPSSIRLRAPDSTDPMTRPNGQYSFRLSINTARRWEPTIQLHIHDERIWHLPAKDSTTYTDDNIIMASDPRLRAPNWGPAAPDGNNPNYGKCRHYPDSPVRILTPECYANALVILMLRDGGTDAGGAWGTQINYLMQYKLYDPEKVHPATKKYMTFPPEVSFEDNMNTARLAFGKIAEEGKIFANWAK